MLRERTEFNRTIFSQLLQEDHDCENTFEMYKICSDHIASQVDLHWKMNHTKREGHASVNGLTISSNMLDILRESPINWGKRESSQIWILIRRELYFLLYSCVEISLNSTLVNNGESTTHSVGDTLQLGIWVHNSLSWPLVDILLQLYLFQDYQNGIINQQLDPCLTTIGCTQVNFSRVSFLVTLQFQFI